MVRPRVCFCVAVGPVVVFGPNNFPFAFNGAAGGDFAAAILLHAPPPLVGVSIAIESERQQHDSLANG